MALRVFQQIVASFSLDTGGLEKVFDVDKSLTEDHSLGLCGKLAHLQAPKKCVADFTKIWYIAITGAGIQTFHNVPAIAAGLNRL